MLNNMKCVLSVLFLSNFLHEHMSSFKNQIDHTTSLSEIYSRQGTQNMGENEREKNYLSQKKSMLI